ncbi:G5 domain-containing protein [Microbacterium lemovicicum]|nr:G5 domain-containing protein [Microbacterium lemovicicum]
MFTISVIAVGCATSAPRSSSAEVPEKEAARFAQTDAQPTAAARVTPTATPTPVITQRQETVTEAIAFEQTSVEDGNLPRGETVVSVVGQAGERALTYTVTLVDGVETARELTSDVVAVAPVAEVVSVGVYDPPPPPAPPAPTAECDPNYADACVPIASDVDCAGGSGNGPAYLDGVARVVGSDIYGLDRDGDGLACER